jgi:hypothetical protein
MMSWPSFLTFMGINGSDSFLQTIQCFMALPSDRGFDPHCHYICSHSKFVLPSELWTTKEAQLWLEPAKLVKVIATDQTLCQKVKPSKYDQKT